MRKCATTDHIQALPVDKLEAMAARLPSQNEPRCTTFLVLEPNRIEKQYWKDLWCYRELLRVLAYPKFRLQSVDREYLLEDLLPWRETWSAAIPRSMRAQVFLDLALKQEVVPLQIINPAVFQSWLATNP